MLNLEAVGGNIGMGYLKEGAYENLKAEAALSIEQLEPGHDYTALAAFDSANDFSLDGVAFQARLLDKRPYQDTGLHAIQYSRLDSDFRPGRAMWKMGRDKSWKELRKQCVFRVAGIPIVEGCFLELESEALQERTLSLPLSRWVTDLVMGHGLN